MDLRDAVRSRHMVRSFSARGVPAGVLDDLLHDALRAPSAGNTGGTAWVVLEGPDQTRRYWDAATTEDWRARSRRWPGLSRAPVLVLTFAAPAAYVARYAEEDKLGAASDIGLGTSEDAWPVPYWWGDAAFGVMTLLLGVVSEGLGACFLGNFRSEAAVLAALDVPAGGGWRLFGAVALGYAQGDDPPSTSLARAGHAATARLHYGRWGGAR